MRRRRAAPRRSRAAQGPALRTMTAHAMAPAERAELSALVGIMVSYGARRRRASPAALTRAQA